MNATVTDQGNCKKQVLLEIPSEEVRQKIDKVAEDLGRSVRVSGFRPGHVPKSVIKTRFRKELRDEVSSQLLPPAFEEAMRENGLKLVGKPALDAISFGDDESIKATFNVDVAPEFDLAEYKKIPLTKHVYKVTDAHVDEAIDHLRKQQAELVPVDRPAQAGDNVQVDIKGEFVTSPIDPNAPAGEEKPPAKPEDSEIKEQELSIVLGGEGVLEEFTKVFTGASAGETKTFTVTYKEDHPVSRFAGKTVRYTAEVSAVRVVELPELDNEFAASVNESFESMDALRAHVRQDLETTMADRTDSEIRAAAIAELLSRNRFQVPDFLVDHQTETRFRSLIRGLQSRGVNVRDPKLDIEALMQGQRPLAEDEVRTAFILGKIVEAENLQSSEQELDDEIEDIAAASGSSVESMRANLTKRDALDSIKEQIERRKALDFVIASADITVEEAVEQPTSPETSEQVNAPDISE